MSLRHDIRLALRVLRRNPVFATAAILSLALGIGANTAIFSIVNGVLLRPAPFADLGRLAMVWETDRSSGTTREPASIPDFLDFQRRSRQFSQLAAFTPLETNASYGVSDPERLAGLAVSRDYFQTLGLQVAAGRTFDLSEDREDGPRAVIISEDLWERRFQRDASAIGQTLRLNDVEHVIIGTMPRGADFGVLQVLGAAAYMRGFAERGGHPKVDVWLPLRAGARASRGNHPIFVVGRLAAASTLVAAQQEMSAIAADLERTYPDDNASRGTYLEPLQNAVFGRVRPALWVLAGAVGLVLLVACANVANLLLARAANRQHEITVRTALGANTRHLLRQFLIESAVLVGNSVALGTLLAYAMLGTLRSAAPPTIPRVDEVGLDAGVFALIAGVSMVMALVLGLLPALHAQRQNLQSALQSVGGRGAVGGRPARMLRSTMVVAELAMATMLMVGAGLMIRSFRTVLRVDPGFSAARVLKAEFELPASRYPQNFAVYPNWTERLRFNAELEARLAELPGVESVALAMANPMDVGATSSIRVVGRENEASDWPEPSIRSVSAQYFSTMGVQIRSGRTFGSEDHTAAAPVVIINESARARYFAGRDPLLSRIDLWGAQRTVIGVVGNERFNGLTADAPPALYLPMTQAPSASTVLVRMNRDAESAIPHVRRVIREIDPQLALFGVEPLAETVRGSVAQQRFTTLVLAVFAAAALMLAIIGVHGVLSYAVAQRTREIGIRVALGAGLADVRWLVVSDGIRLSVTGLTVGLLGALALSRLMRALLYGIEVYDPLTFAGVAVLLGAVALVACWLPARQAARVDPMVAMRAD
jgi:putative ABC transport system permease protein